MAIVFDTVARRIVLDSTSTSAVAIYSEWVNWVATGDNAKHLPAMRSLGGDDLGSGLLIPPYVFLLNGWRVRPMEQDHDLVITGNLFVEGGGTPVVRTLGPWQVNTNYTVPVQAQAVATGGGAGLTSQQVTDAVWNALTTNHQGAGSFGKLVGAVLTIGRFLGLR